MQLNPETERDHLRHSKVVLFQDTRFLFSALLCRIDPTLNAYELQGNGSPEQGVCNSSVKRIIETIGLRIEN